MRKLSSWHTEYKNQYGEKKCMEGVVQRKNRVDEKKKKWKRWNTAVKGMIKF
jgi:hypothetical protein